MCEGEGLRSGYVIASPGWTPEAANPFDPGGAYGPSWSCFRVEDADDDRRISGREPNGLFLFRVGRRCDRLWERLGDFLTYEAQHGRTVVVSLPADMDAGVWIERALAGVPPPDVVRDSGPQWLVHSTSEGSWDAIRACGELRAASVLRGQGVNLPMVGTVHLGDPPDYEDHVALGRMGSIHTEYVVACQNAGHLLDEADTVYAPGVRLYFDAHLITRNGLAVRDGLHELKVHGRLPLKPYLKAAIGLHDVDPEGTVGQWRTSTFQSAANALFAHRLERS